MQTYRDDTTISPASFVPGPQNGIQTKPDEMNKYKNMYEERINPFEAFRGRVSGGVNTFLYQGYTKANIGSSESGTSA